MDREGRGHIGERAVAVKAVQQIGHKSGMPVVDVDHVRLEVQRAEHLEQRAAEIDEARVVVTESVHAVAVIQRRTVDEVDGHLADAAFIDGCLDRLRAQGHSESTHHRRQAVARDVYLPVAGQHRADVVTEPAQLFRQGRGHVGDSAELGERRQLRRSHQDLERPGLAGLDRGDSARDPQPERAVWWHLLDVVAVAADDQRKLDGLAGAPPKLLERDLEKERIRRIPLGLLGGLVLRLRHPGQCDVPAAGAGLDADDMSWLEAELRCGCCMQRQADRAVSAVRGRARAVEPQVDALSLELGRRPLSVDPEVEILQIIAVEHTLHDARGLVQSAESGAHLKVAGLGPGRVVVGPRADLNRGHAALGCGRLLKDRLEQAGRRPLAHDLVHVAQVKPELVVPDLVHARVVLATEPPEPVAALCDQDLAPRGGRLA